MRSFDWQTAPLNRSLSLEASAGTGKTFTLEHLVYRLVAESGLDLEQILVVTFTNKAAREMEDRIRKILKQGRKDATGKQRERLQRATREFDRSSIYTIHGFCRHVIQTYSFEIGVPFQMELGQDSLRDRRDIRDWFRRNETSTEPLIRLGFRYSRGAGFGGTEGVIDRLLDLQGQDLPLGSHRLFPTTKAREKLVEMLEQGKSSQLSQKLKLWDSQLDRNNLYDQFVREKLITKRTGRATVEGFLKIWDSLAEKNFHPMEWIRLSGKILKQIDKGKPQESPFWRAKTELLDLVQDCHTLWGSDWGLTLEWAFFLRVLEDLDRERKESLLDRVGYRFSDLIQLVHQTLTGEEQKSLPLLKALRNNYRMVLIDEFQDTDRLQWEIFQKIFQAEGHHFILIGDPKQSIYRFRGADLNIYNRAVSEIPEEDRYQLDRNYRSTPELVEIFNGLFSNMFRPFKKEGAPVFYHPVGSQPGKAPILTREGHRVPPLVLQNLPAPEKGTLSQASQEWMEQIAVTISDLTCSGKYELNGTSVHGGHIAILMEGNRNCMDMQQHLQQRGIPSVISGERNIFESEAMSVVQGFLSLLADRSDRSSLNKLMLSSLFLLSSQELVQASEMGLLDRLIQEWDSRLKATSDLERLFRGFLGDGDSLCRALGREEKDPPLVRLVGRPGGERLITDLFHLLELFQQQMKEDSLDFSGLLQLSRSGTFQTRLEEQKKVRLEKEGQVVQIMTHHSSKGLQFPILFFAGAFNRDILSKKNQVLRFNRNGEIHFCGSRDEEIKKQAEREEWLEKLKLYYVALTRTESRLYLPLLKEWSCKPRLLNLYQEMTDSPCSEEEASNALQEQLLKEFPHWVEVVSEQSAQAAAAPEPPQLELPALQQGPFSGRYAGLSSFSSLVRQVDRTHFLLEEHSPEKEEEPADETILSEAEDLPRNLAGGKNLGNLLHLCFEEMDFSWAGEDKQALWDNRDFQQLLERVSGRYFPTDWFRRNRESLTEMIYQTLHSPLDALGGRRLSSLSEDEKKHELEFHMRVKEGVLAFQGEKWSLEKGYLKGFLDLVFLHEGRYYILDWKSTANPKHPPRGGYSSEDLNRIMKDHRYDLQAMIYWGALTRLLQKIKGPEFHDGLMGGVFYLFLRGMDQQGEGVWFSRPEPTELEAFEEIFLQEESR